MRHNEKVFDKVLDLMSKHGELKITFTPENVAEGDDFLIFSAWQTHTCTIKFVSSGIMVFFDHDDPLHLEDCPDSFLESIVKNAPKD